MREFKDIRQTPEWAEYIKKLKGEVYEIGGREKLFVYAFKTPFGKICKIQRPFDLTREMLDELSSTHGAEKFLFCKIEPTNHKQAQLLEEHGFKKSNSPILPMRTIVIKTANGKENFSERAIRNIKKAESSGVAFEFLPAEEKNLQEYLQLQELVKKESKAQGKTFLYVKENVLNSLINSFGPKKAFFAKALSDKREVLGSDLIIISEKCGWYMFNAVTGKGKELGAGHFLVTKTLETLSERGVDWFDFDGVFDDRIKNAYNGWQGFTEFKQNFGGQEIEFPYPCIKAYGPILKLFQKLL